MKILEATMTQLRGKALEHLAIVEALLDNPQGMITEEYYVDKIIKHIKEVMICENSLNALQLYFMPKQGAPPEQPPSPDD